MTQLAVYKGKNIFAPLFSIQEDKKQVKKDRKSYYVAYNNRPEIKFKRKLARLAKERTKKAQQNELNAKYYGAEAINVLMTLKEYTELNKDKKKLWLDFNWTLQNCKEGVGDIVPIMKLAQVADNLIRDYWKTAKDTERKEKESWDSLSYDKQQRLIKYWGKEKARKENKYFAEEERLSKQSEEHAKETEISKLHEERGKIKCECWSCEEKKEIQNEIKKDWNEELKVIEKEQEQKYQCLECDKWVKELDEETEACRKCSAILND